MRLATAADAAACAAIYRPYVLDTAVTFETDPPDAARDGAAHHRAPWPRTPGSSTTTAGGSAATPTAARTRPARPTAGRARSASTSSPGAGAPGAGRRLYTELFARLAARGYRTAVAGMTLPNDASVGPAPRAGLRAGGHVPADRLEARRVARRRLGAAPAGGRRRRPGRTHLTAATRVTSSSASTRPGRSSGSVPTSANRAADCLRCSIARGRRRRARATGRPGSRAARPGGAGRRGGRRARGRCARWRPRRGARPRRPGPWPGC